MNYDNEIAKLYTQILDLKEWLLKNTPSLNEFADLNQRLLKQVETLALRIQLLELKLKLLESKVK